MYLRQVSKLLTPIRENLPIRRLAIIITILSALPLSAISIYVPYAVLSVTVLLESSSESLALKKALISKLRKGLVKAGINGPTAHVICSGEFVVLNGIKRVGEGKNKYLMEAETNYKSKELVLENLLLLLAGLSTIGLLSSYVIAFIYGGELISKYLFLLICFIVYIFRYAMLKKIGRLIHGKQTEIFSIVILWSIVAVTLRNYLEPVFLIIGFVTLLITWRASAKRRVIQKKEESLFEGLIKAFTGSETAVTKKVLFRLSQAEALKASELVLNPDVSELLTNTSNKLSRSELSITLRTIAIAVSAFGYRHAWTHSVILLQNALERLHTRFEQQIIKNEFMTTLMFSVSATSLSILTKTAFFSLSTNPLTNLMPLLALNCCLMSFSYIYSSDRLFMGLCFGVSLIENLSRIFN
jgi:hypothetical protein